MTLTPPLRKLALTAHVTLSVGWLGGGALRLRGAVAAEASIPYHDIMKRTVISLEDREKAWLDAAAAREGVPATELVRRAVKLLREREPLERQPFDELLRRTSGLWRRGDGLAYQERLRDEW